MTIQTSHASRTHSRLQLWLQIDDEGPPVHVTLQFTLALVSSVQASPLVRLMGAADLGRLAIFNPQLCP